MTHTATGSGPGALARTTNATVVGGGPAGLMAAEVMARAGVRVTVYEHMPSVGRKLLLAGRGGLNITHSEDAERFLTRYREASAFLAPHLASFDADALRAWCADLGEPTFVGSSGRVFPEGFRATPLLRAWLRRLAELGVTFATRHRWSGWKRNVGGGIEPDIDVFVRSDGTVVEVSSDVTVLALGGASWPRVGSDGGWVDHFRSAGIAVAALRPANSGAQVSWSGVFADRFTGVPIKNVAVSADDNPFGASRVRGDLMVTSSGLEGGPVYAHSATLRDMIDQVGHATLFVDLQPDVEAIRLVDRLSRRRRKDSVTNSLRRAAGLQPIEVGLMREATTNDLPTDPAALASLIKAVPVRVDALMPIDRAISSSGGVQLGQVDESLMLRALPGNFVAGEMLDWEAPTGGYLLQASLSTAVSAARGAVAWAASKDGSPTGTS